MVCGHIHRPELRTISTDSGTALYANCGDWVENCTALVEHWDGRLEIVRWTAALPAPGGDGQAAADEPALAAAMGTPADGLAHRVAVAAQAASVGLPHEPVLER